ncbi:MAG: SDR family oxidoreductase, partial [Myxococcales bacterium]
MKFPPHPDRRPVLIAGASSGIGAAAAHSLAAAGHPVALGARRVDELASLQDSIKGEVFAHRLDVADDDSVRKFVAAAAEALGPVEAIVSSAAMLRPGRIRDMEPADFAQEVSTNVLGVQRLVHAVVPGMVERGRGDVVLVSSDVADTVRPFMSAYATAKWAIEGFARSLRLELEGTGVRVGVIRPGPTMTGMGMDWNAEDTGMVLTEWGRLGLTRSGHFMNPASVADLVTVMVDQPRGVTIPLLEVQPEI